MIGKIFAVLGVLAMAGMIIVPLIPYFRVKIENLGKDDKPKQPPYELL